jgi:hypothetical protein
MERRSKREISARDTDKPKSEKEERMMVTPLKGSRTRGLGLFFGLSALLVYGCNTSVEQPQAVQQASPQAPAVSSLVSVNALMVALVDHASHELWNVEREGRAPKNDAEWREVEHHATQLAGSGTLIALGGTGKADPGWAQLPDWKKYSQQLNDAGMAALSAARAKNLEALVKVNGQLVEVCESCHKQFKPELPTEGIIHPHEE